MRNVTLPAPVLAVGGVFCLLAGALTGFVLARQHGDDSTATVASYDTHDSVLCLRDASASSGEKNSDGELCGVWRRSGVESFPHVGERFRYVVVRTSGTSRGRAQEQTVIYGDVVR